MREYVCPASSKYQEFPPPNLSLIITTRSETEFNRSNFIISGTVTLGAGCCLVNHGPEKNLDLGAI